MGVAIAVFWIFVCPVTCGSMLMPYGKGARGFLLGLLLGPVGLILVIAIRDREDEKLGKALHARAAERRAESSECVCPKCAGPVFFWDRTCMHCGFNLEQYIPVRKKVFVSYGIDEDKILLDAITAQSRGWDSPFEVAEHSLEETGPEDSWLTKTTAAIQRCDVFVIMLGPTTRYTPGVLRELAVATALAKEKLQIIGYRDGPAEWAVPDGGPVYKVNRKELKRLLGRRQFGGKDQ